MAGGKGGVLPNALFADRCSTWNIEFQGEKPGAWHLFQRVLMPGVWWGVRHPVG